MNVIQPSAIWNYKNNIVFQCAVFYIKNSTISMMLINLGVDSN